MSTKPTSEAAAPAETPDTFGAFPRLDDAQLAALGAFGAERTIGPEEPLFTEGERNCDFYIVLDGHVASVEGYRTPTERMAREPQRYAGCAFIASSKPPQSDHLSATPRLASILLPSMMANAAS